MNWMFNEYQDGLSLQGIRDSDIDTFDRHRYASIVRESIQNSLDAKKQEAEKVKVTFKLFTIKKDDLKHLLEINTRLHKCKAYASDFFDEADVELIDSMLYEYENSGNEIEILKITDTNTIGMSPKAIRAFKSGRNVNDKNSKTAGGSKGLGKSAYFCLSYLRTVVISTLFESEENTKMYNMIGISKIASHSYNDKLFCHQGYFCEIEDNNGSISFIPTQNKALYPSLQHPLELTGTSINVIGLWPEEDRVAKMAKSILNNFWLAIHHDRLEVEIICNQEIPIVFNKQTIFELIDNYWNDNNHEPNISINPNPRQYFKTYIEDDKKVYSKYYEEYGTFNLILGLGQDYSGRISFFRNTKMLIYKQKHLEKGMCGIFWCDDEKANVLLRKMENALHDEWSPENYKTNKKEATKIKKYIDSFINDSINNFRTVSSSNQLSFPELAISDKKKNRSNRTDAEGDHAKPDLKKTKNKRNKPPVIKEAPFSFFVWLNQFDGGGYPVYELHIDSEKEFEQVKFQIVVASDIERISTEVFIPLRLLEKLNRGGRRNRLITDDNTFITDLKEGLNKFIFSLEDKMKHSVDIKYILL